MSKRVFGWGGRARPPLVFGSCDENMSIFDKLLNKIPGDRAYNPLLKAMSLLLFLILASAVVLEFFEVPDRIIRIVVFVYACFWLYYWIRGSEVRNRLRARRRREQAYRRLPKKVRNRLRAARRWDGQRSSRGDPG
jgi:hypothetical protein